MKHQSVTSRQATQDSGSDVPRIYNRLTSMERGYSYHVAAAKCDEVSSQLEALAGLLRCTRPDPSEPKCPFSERALVESLIRGRRLRDKFFDAGLFADPVWDILLDLYLASLDQRRTAISSLCVAAAVPTTTALRHISLLVDRGMLVRQPSRFDHRVIYVELAEATVAHVRSYLERFSELLCAAVGR
jgi:DNA-binding MarR family transcriptional regulator